MEEVTKKVGEKDVQTRRIQKDEKSNIERKKGEKLNERKCQKEKINSDKLTDIGSPVEQKSEAKQKDASNKSEEKSEGKIEEKSEAKQKEASKKN